MPDDPRGALRWSLSKLRPVVNDGDVVRMVADRERVALDLGDVDLDRSLVECRLGDPALGYDGLLALYDDLAEPLLAGLEFPEQSQYQAWLVRERDEQARLRGRIAEQLIAHAETPPETALTYARAWLDEAPYDAAAATAVLRQLERLGRAGEAATLNLELARRFDNAGVEFRPAPATFISPQQQDMARQLLARQTIRFCRSPDGVNLAYATVGDGPPIVKAANWLNHLELDWDAPIWSPLFRELARDHQFVRYDERGNGLSDWDVDELTFDAFVTDLETVVDSLGLEQFPLLGISQGASVSIEYAVRHPERVSHLILFGGYPAGWRIDASEELIREREAIITLTESGWGQDNPAYRQIFSSTFMPDATPDELGWFNEFQRQTASPKNAARFLAAFGDIDVRHRLAEVSVPTLVLHARGDQRIPFTVGRDLAARIPGARFVGLDSNGHLLLGREAASAQFVEAVREFIDD
ncbi:MAG: alpha/beta fold hydrolase [Pseudomonadota bacterium]